MQTTKTIQPVNITKHPHPYEQINWIKTSAVLSNMKGEKIFEKNNLEFPDFWSQTAISIVASKYFQSNETSLKQLIDRVVNTITGWGVKDGYFNEAESHIYNEELTNLLVHQMAAFNSPVWFNCGVHQKPQCSACFILSVKDSMESILDLAKTEGMLFKFGSGSGVNLSPLRSSKEFLSNGGVPSGPVSFMKGLDAFAGVIKSGGKTRRAAKMVMLNIDHPDIVEFIECKAKEERKAWKLIDAGFDGSMDGEAYQSIFFQNGNNSVRASNAFMQAVTDDKPWQTRAVKDKKIIGEFKARDLMQKISQGTYDCGDPGIQFDDTMNEWHTCKNSGRINGSNPCSEYVFLDDSACNLASLNLMKFINAEGEFDIPAFERAVKIMITAQEIIVGNAGYPTPKIEKNSHAFRPLGLGYANLGALLMSRGLAYDSSDGRNYAAALTALMGGTAYLTSAELAKQLGTFSEYEKNKEPMLGVIQKHKLAAEQITEAGVPQKLLDSARKSWQKAYQLGEKFGYRNAQVTVLAPTGTIGFMMDCDTTGIEPDIALVKYKKMVGGGVLKIVNQTVGSALKHLGYGQNEIKEILAYIDAHDGIEGAPHIKEEHLSVFDCAFKAPQGKRYIHYLGHIKMMAAVQPFISGAISKTVNMPTDCTVEEISQAYLDAWKMGLKCVAIYREGSKRIQPLNTKKESSEEKKIDQNKEFIRRRRLKDERQSITHKFSVAGHEGYITVGLFEDGTPGEIFIRMAKEGSTVSGLMDTIATTSSIMLQYGVPLEFLVKKFCHTRFEPMGITTNKHIPFAKSIVDYVFRYMAYKFLPAEVAKNYGIQYLEELTAVTVNPIKTETKKETKGEIKQNKIAAQTQEDAPACHQCGAMMVRSGSCYKCLECGETSGCS
jgi:ribonucleoside-diphosphate reductase alpha chain